MEMSKNSRKSGSNDRMKNLCDIAAEISDFEIECSPGITGDASAKTGKQKIEEIMQAVQDNIEDCFNYSPANENSPAKALKEIFAFYEQIQGVAVGDELDEISLAQESKILEKTIQALSYFADEKDKRQTDGYAIDMKNVQSDFVKYKKILKDTIATVFQDNAEEVSQLLKELTKREYNHEREDDFFNLSTEHYSDDVVNALTRMGIIELREDDDTQIQLVKMNC